MNRGIAATTITLAALLVVLSAPAGISAGVTADSAPTNVSTQLGDEIQNATTHPKSPIDTVGWEDGYWYDDPVAITRSDGINESELEMLTARAMARVEILRGQEFQRSVSVNVQSRTEYQSSSPFQSSSSSNYSKWNNQVWESLFIVDSQSNISEELDKVYSGGVVGYYQPGTEEIVVVSDSSGSLSVSESTLIHELVHALQDQRFSLSDQRYRANTQDAQLAMNGLIEGEAKYIEKQYRQQCATTWECQRTPATGSSGSSANNGIQILLYQPYADGAEFIRTTVASGGWEAVDSLFESPPTSSSEIIHQDTSKKNTPLAPLPAQTDGWHKYETLGVDGADTLGEASVFVMFWYQNSNYNINTIPRSSIRDADGTLSYDHSVSTGLVNDQLTPYQKNDAHGYVWQLAWDSEEDATEFVQTYRAVLRGHGGDRVSETVTKLPAGTYADTFYVEHNGRNVTIVNGPSQEAVKALAPTEMETNPLEYKLRQSADVSTVVGIVLPILCLVYALFRLN
jgi:hypothetical protein